MSWKNYNQYCPCTKCEQRSGSCHDSCAAYMAWAEEHRAKQKDVVPIAEAYTLSRAALRKTMRMNKK